MIELIKYVDSFAHAGIAFTLFYLALTVPDEHRASRGAKVICAFLSLFLCLTCMQYGRTMTYKIVHAMWEIAMLVNFLIVAKTMYKSQP
jgi:hypothetical protein